MKKRKKKKKKKQDYSGFCYAIAMNKMNKHGLLAVITFLLFGFLLIYKVK